MLSALASLGATVERVDDGVRVSGRAPVSGDVAIDLGNAGTVARFTPPLAALSGASVRYDSDPAMRRRPIAPLLQALRDLGADIDGDAFPLTVRGAGSLRGGSVELDSSASSQFLSALLLAAPAMDDGVHVRLRGAVPSEPHIAMTFDLLSAFGAAPARDGVEFVVPAMDLACTAYDVEPDLSTAAPFVAAALVTGGRVRIAGWPASTTQPGDWLREFVGRLGGAATPDDGGLLVQGPDGFDGLELDLHAVGELTPVVAAVLCLADSPSTIRGVGHLRGHETDRIAALAKELSALGAGVSELDDGLVIEPRPLHGGLFHTYDDHRLVMAAAVLGLRIDALDVENPETVGKTFPGFIDAWRQLID